MKPGREVLFFSSPTCAPCKTLKPWVLTLSFAHKFKMTVIEASAETQAKFLEYGVRASPTVVALENGVEIGRFSGLKHPNELDAIMIKWGFA